MKVIGQMNRRAIELVELLRKTNEKKKLSFKIKEIQQKKQLLLPKQCTSAVKLLPERRSGYKTFTGTAFRPVPVPLHPCPGLAWEHK